MPRPNRHVTSSKVPAGWRVALVVILALALGALVFAQGAIPQPPGYFRFVDGRTLLGVPNACNVLSNVAFALVGAAGLWLFASGRVRLPDRKRHLLVVVRAHGRRRPSAVLLRAVL